MDSQARRRLIVALDFPQLAQAEAVAQRLSRSVGMFKVGSQLFTAEGPRAVERLARFGPGIFLDLKFHDIPNTVVGALASAARLTGVRLVNVHALGGYKMMCAAAKALPGGRRKPAVLAVTILTSVDETEFERLGLRGAPPVRALKLARLAQRAGLEGVVASAQEARDIRRACGKRFLIVVPGIRPAPSAWNDQVRVATPADAIRAGADYIVVGRSVIEAENPKAALLRVIESIA